MKIDYDATVDALSVTLRKGKVDRTVEIAPEIAPKIAPSEPHLRNHTFGTTKIAPSEPEPH